MENVYPVTTLSNGLQVVTHRLPGRDSLAVGIWMNVGSRHETPAISGISHFIEHLVFKGTKKRSAKDIKLDIEGRGGILNAFTSEDTTCFFVKMAKEHLTLAVDVLSDMVFTPRLDAKEIERERTVILEEIKMYHDMPMHYAHDLVNQLVWPNQPLGMFIAGTLDSVSGITRKNVVDYHNQFYAPNNACISVCGDIAHADVVREVQRMVTMKTKKKAFGHEPAHARQSKPRFHMYEKDTAQAHMVIAMHGLKREHKDRQALGLLHMIMGANMSSRLYEEVREKRGLAYEIRSGVHYYADVGSFVISAGIENGKEEQTAIIIRKELEKVIRRGVTVRELAHAKEYLLNHFYFGLEDTMDHMLWMGEKALHTGDVPTREGIKERVERVTREDIQRVAASIFKTKKMSVVVIGNMDKKRQAKIKEVFA